MEKLTKKSLNELNESLEMLHEMEAILAGKKE
jgi:hypothetical protein